MIANQIGPWLLLFLGVSIDTWLALGVIVNKVRGKRASTVPLVAIFFYLLFSMTRRMTGQNPMWHVCLGAIFLHLLWHFVAVPWINRDGSARS